MSVERSDFEIPFTRGMIRCAARIGGRALDGWTVVTLRPWVRRFLLAPSTERRLKVRPRAVRGSGQVSGLSGQERHRLGEFRLNGDRWLALQRRAHS
jgi:hypothetical protein